MKTACGVIVKFVEAMVMAHYIGEDHRLTTVECWDMLANLAPAAMDWWIIECEQWSECPTGEHTTPFSEITFATRAVEIQEGSTWIPRDEAGNVHGVWRWKAGEEFAECCPGDDSDEDIADCGRARWRLLSVVGASTSHFVLRFHGGCDPALLEHISSGGVVSFNGTAWAVWCGAWEFEGERVDACYIVPKKNGDLFWARFNTAEGKITVPQSTLSAENCIELIFVRPPRSCWCGEVNDGDMEQCTRRNCKRLAHRACIKKSWPGYRLKTWYNGRGCKQPDCERLQAEKAAAKKAAAEQAAAEKAAADKEKNKGKNKGKKQGKKKGKKSKK